mmetsp:Transcript_23447/g.59432  ORF Transcript_23447/g.59432 Transcript_23447/m.59432 type:complete len:639 (+) Transcript_23447:1427-3343(+)
MRTSLCWQRRSPRPAPWRALARGSPPWPTAQRAPTYGRSRRAPPAAAARSCPSALARTTAAAAAAAVTAAAVVQASRPMALQAGALNAVGSSPLGSLDFAGVNPGGLLGRNPCNLIGQPMTLLSPADLHMLGMRAQAQALGVGAHHLNSVPPGSMTALAQFLPGGLPGLQALGGLVPPFTGLGLLPGSQLPTKPKHFTSRLVWTQELHARFLNAVNVLGGHEKACPSAILKQMEQPNMTKAHVKSHLQKFRMLKKGTDWASRMRGSKSVWAKAALTEQVGATGVEGAENDEDADGDEDAMMVNGEADEDDATLAIFCAHDEPRRLLRSLSNRFDWSDKLAALSSLAALGACSTAAAGEEEESARMPLGLALTRAFESHAQALRSQADVQESLWQSLDSQRSGHANVVAALIRLTDGGQGSGNGADEGGSESPSQSPAEETGADADSAGADLHADSASVALTELAEMQAQLQNNLEVQLATQKQLAAALRVLKSRLPAQKPLHAGDEEGNGGLSEKPLLSVRGEDATVLIESLPGGQLSINIFEDSAAENSGNGDPTQHEKMPKASRQVGASIIAGFGAGFVSGVSLMAEVAIGDTLQAWNPVHTHDIRANGMRSDVPGSGEIGLVAHKVPTEMDDLSD